MTGLAVYVERLRRRWVLVVALGVLAALAVLVGSVFHTTTWTGRSALAVVSQNRSPDQDAVIGRGYVDLFNQPSVQAELTTRLRLPASVRFSARLAVGSPIVYVEATAPDPGLASGAAIQLASTLRDDVRNNLTGDRVQAADGLTAQIRAAQARLGALPAASPDRSSVLDQISSLQTQLSTLQANTTNQLKDLQLDAGVTPDSTGTARSVVLALVGGLAVGVVVALGLGRLEQRLDTPAEVRDRLGREVLASGGDDDGFRSLADVLALPALPLPGSLALTTAGPADVGARDRVAGHLAALRARQHGTALLVEADPEHAVRADPGVADVLDRRRGLVVTDVVRADGDLLVVPAGGAGADSEVLFARDRVAELVRQGREIADLVVVAAPAASGAAGATVCGAVDRTVLVVRRGVTRVSDARSAIERIERAGGTLLGIVLIDGSGGVAPAPPSSSVPDDLGGTSISEEHPRSPQPHGAAG